ncbi:MAG TPA: CocE/NonD family hydrolase [Glaciibacter sp.]|nr:CocE/NonD family hydrolase [Glaciibacter sp.]
MNKAERSKTWRRRIGGLVLISVGLAAAGLFYLMYVNPVSGEEIVPAGHARNTASYITMPDGTRLAADVWVPPGLEASEKLPAILTTTRYTRALEMGPIFRLMVGVGEERVPNIDMADQWNTAGYALVLVDARGSGASFGQRPVEWSDAEVADLGEITEWITAQPWSDGTVGAVGISYSGNSAELSTIPAHPALRAVAPLYNDFDPQFFLAMPGGVLNRGFAETWNAGNQAFDANDVCALQDVDGLACWWAKLATPGVKPVDADPGGELLKDAVEGHETLDLASALQNVTYRDDPVTGDVTIGDISPYSRLESIEATDTPMLVRTGWLDAATTDGALSRYLTSDMPQELVIGAWNHGGEDDVDPFQPRFTFPHPTFDDQFDDLVNFFDRHLHDKSESVPVPNSIRYYTMNEGQWRTTPTWPPAEMEAQRWYLGADQALTDSPPVTAGEDEYAVDPSASSGETNRWQTNYTSDDVYYPDRAEEDARLLTYTGAPLTADLRITGTPVLSLQLSSTHADGALHVYLEDVAPDGRVTYLTEGILRLIHNVSEEASLPYEHPGPPRSFLRADAEPITPGQVTQVDMPLYATSVRLEAGHRLRIAIAGSDASAFAQYPETGAEVLTVVHSPASPSFLELPVTTD